MPPLAALLAAAATSLPAFALSYYLVSGRGKSLGAAWNGFLMNAPVVVPIYFLGALVFGTVLWLALRALGLLSLLPMLLGSVVPVLLLVFGHSALRGGVGPGVHLVLFALGLPCVIMAFVLWFFGVRAGGGQ